eukprot:7642321-Prorocentrum_lima.AAC.1
MAATRSGNHKVQQATHLIGRVLKACCQTILGNEAMRLPHEVVHAAVNATIPTIMADNWSQ